MADYANITLARDGAVARLTLNRPDRRNALTHAMMLELEDAFGRLRGRPVLPRARAARRRRAFLGRRRSRRHGRHAAAAGRRGDRPAGRGLSPVRRRAAGAEQPAAGHGGDRRRLGGGRRLRHGLLLRCRHPARERALRHAGAEGRLHSLADHSVRGAPDRARGRRAISPSPAGSSMRPRRDGSASAAISAPARPTSTGRSRRCSTTCCGSSRRRWRR